MIDISAFCPSQCPRDTPYARMEVLYDDGRCADEDGLLVAGRVLNGAFPQPYFNPAWTYLVMTGRIMRMPDYES